MARPRIVRADTLDLQDHHAPFAKDHSKYPIETDSGLAPHQENTLRHADQDSRAEMLNDPDTDQLNGNHYHEGMDIHDGLEGIDDGLGHHNRGAGSEEGDLADEESDDMLDDDLMDKISSSPSIDDEDIDFEFVYALHNFVATVDGQANAAKGDTMVLLDDSNSYWWLVRIVKDGSIGYLPAEHIETPTERLARLNKHRNVDLSATMLGDNSEKSKNPLKKAMRRRNAKTVTFTSPTYIEASDVDYSTDDDLDDGDSLSDGDMLREDDDIREDQNDDIVVEPLRPKPNRDRVSDESEIVDELHQSGSISPEKQRSSQEISDATNESTISRSRNGTVRNTDSFFKDDTVETKKISLTPNLLRDEVNNSNVTTETKEGRGSLENFDKALGLNDKGKEDKKRKDKKPGMLSGLFKRKDKKTKSNEDDAEEPEKISGELSRTSPTPKTSSESVSSPESRPSKITPAQKQASKLQKPTSIITSPSKQEPQQGTVVSQPSLGGEDALLKVKQKSDTIRQVLADDDDVLPPSPGPIVPVNMEEVITPPVDNTTSFTSRSPSKTDDLNASIESPESPPEPRQSPYDRMVNLQPSVSSPPQRSPQKQQNEYHDRTVESPVSVSPMETSAPLGLGPTLSSPRDQSASPISPPFSPNDDKTAGSLSPPLDVISPDTHTWSDASLRSYLDDENDIRDLYIIVHDNSNIPPAGPEHPITGSLFKEESRRIKEMGSQLDLMLADWVGRRARTASATRSASIASS
ncbi:putative SH3 domain protein [Aspergillus clavatus NRRL 1]|uniref:SH3 domain protein, putative n=1 Tax=Aspergillus clavatus (strain ATCC 1007 / CBS 513.65 / DSM 816 / NCTC 3887 / NRRL 1 / QM 1276 / 107) TaxID=344612 RepID=A1CPT3_ASPCL|nr:SH3 domain protein, putative [Aspergillus clavatus NRRL 1]EAW07654.1 SH3 domain protein, putative [Aspergillus clavatus NRRL 1]